MTTDRAERPTKVPCMGCDRRIPSTKTLCAACAEDMGYARRAR